MIRLRLNELLEERGWTLYRLAKVSGVRVATVYKLARGDYSRLMAETLDRIIGALECEAGELIVHEPGAQMRKKAKKGRKMR